MVKVETMALIEQYIQEVHQIGRAIASGQSRREELLALIETRIQEVAGDTVCATFFQAELSFYQQRYEESLRGYLTIKAIPYHHFFCYRASAFLSAQLQEREKALDFAKRALGLQHQDLETLRLCRELGLGSDLMLQEETSAVGDEEAFVEREQRSLLAEEEKPFQEVQKQHLKAYAQRQSHGSLEDCLVLFSGWEERDELHWLTEGLPSCQGGYYLRWGGTGVALNPGRQFLRRMQGAGIHIRDIDCVLCTSSYPEGDADLWAIYRLNQRVNRETGHHHLIHFYLNRTSYQLLSRQVKPLFKQEASALHCLELYLDSPERESISLSDAIRLHYFPTIPAGDLTAHPRAPIGVWMELLPLTIRSDKEKPFCLGYLSGTPWSPHFIEPLRKCDLLIVGMEQGISSEDTKDRAEAALGVSGALSLFNEVNPRLMFCCEWNEQAGDQRLALVRKMRQEAKGSGVILPGEIGLKLFLPHLKVGGLEADPPIDSTEVRVVQSKKPFGPLRFVAPQQLL